jgi:hypothetical protein
LLGDLLANEVEPGDGALEGEAQLLGMKVVIGLGNRSEIGGPGDDGGFGQMDVPIPKPASANEESD